MTPSAESVRILSHALDQAGDVLDHVRDDRLSLPTPCRDWDVGALADHLVNDVGQFLTLMRGGQPDWSAPAPHLVEGWASSFRVAADDLIHLWHEAVAGEVPAPAQPPEWQCAELALHTWDLAVALGVPPVSALDPAVAEAGLGFMSVSLTPQMRGTAFDPEQEPPAGAGPYERLAAFSGRTVPATAR